MKNIILVKCIALLVMLVGIIVMFGWFFNIEVLKSILPIWVTMKFTTALSFFLSGLTLFFVAEVFANNVELAQIILPITTLVILLTMATLLASTFLGIRTGIEDLFVKEKIGAVNTSTPGRPSAGTMVCFILIALSALLSIFKRQSSRHTLSVNGWIVAGIGSFAIVGYFINVPLFYYALDGLSSAMAFHTAVLFLLLGAGFILLGKHKIS